MLNNDILYAALAGLTIVTGLFSLFLAIRQYVLRRLEETPDPFMDPEIDGQQKSLLDVPTRLAVLHRVAPKWIEPSESLSASYDELFRTGGRPAGALTGRDFLRACYAETIWLFVLAMFCLLAAWVFMPVQAWVWIAVGGAAILLGGPNLMWTIRNSARTHSENVTREVPYFLDLLRLVMLAGGNFQVAIDTFLKSVPTGSMRREALLMRQQLAQGDAAVLRQLAERVTDPAVAQVIGTLAKGIETGGDPTEDAKQAERLRLIRTENAKALAKKLNTTMIFIVALAFFGVVLSIFAAVTPILEGTL